MNTDKRIECVHKHAAERNTNVRSTNRRKNFEADRRFTHTFQIFHGNQQGWDAGDAGSLGAEKRNHDSGDGRYDTSCMAAGTEG